MNIGFVWIYHWTGLYKQKSELQKICLDNDIKASELICDGDLDFCYTKERSRRPGFITCTVCKLRRSSSTILKDQHKFIFNHNKDIKPNYEFAKSSLNTLIDSDDPEILNNPIISQKTSKKIFNTQKKFSDNLNNYLDKKNINLVCTLNGRMDTLRLTHQELIKRGIPFFCFERSFLNLGLAIYPNMNCQDLSFLKKLAEVRKKINLKTERKNYVLDCIKQRTKGSLSGEYANFKKANISFGETSKKKYNVSFLLSTESEIFYDMQGWRSFADALKSIVNILGNEKVCVKGHPLWSKDIQGTRSTRKEYKCFLNNDEYYSSLCKETQVEYISSNSAKSSLEIAKESRLVVIQGSSIFFELALLNVPLLCIRRGFFNTSEAVTMATNQSELDSNSNFLKQIIRSKSSPLNPESTINDAINIFHVLAFDMPILHKNICQTTNEVRNITFKSFFEKHKNYNELSKFYNLLINN